MALLQTHDFSGIASGASPVGAWNNADGGSGSRTFAQRSASQTLVGAPSGGGITAANTTINGHAGALSFQAPRWGRIEFLVDQSGGNTNSFGANVWANAAVSPTIYERARLNTTAIELRDYAPGTTLIGQDSYSKPAANLWLHFSTDPRYGLEYTVKDAANSAILRAYARPVPGSSASGALPGPAAPGDWWSFGFQDSSQPQVAKFMKARLDDGQSAAPTPPTITSPGSVKTGRTTANITLSIASAVGGEIWYVLTPTNVAPADFDAMVAGLNNYQVVSANGAQTIGLTSLTAGTTYYAWILARNATRDRTAVVAAGSFTTDAPLAAPAGSTAIYVEGGKVTLVYTPTGGPVTEATGSLPAATPANGAVTQSPTSLVFGAAGWPGAWSYAFYPPAGDYDLPVTLAKNEDYPAGVSITGATAFYIDDATGTATPAEAADHPAVVAPKGGKRAWRRKLLLELAA